MPELKAEPRTIKGKQVKTLREKGMLPAVLYGAKVDSTPIAVSLKDFQKVFKEAGETSLVTLEVGGKPHDVLIHDIEFDPVKGTPLHADFYAVRMDKEIRARVPLAFIGDSAAVKNEGGILIKVAHEVEVEALPKDLPHQIEVDLAALSSIGSRIFAKDLKLPAGVKLHAHEEDVVAVVEAPRTEEELKELAEAPVEASPAEVKTEAELKRAAKAEAEAKEGEAQVQAQPKKEGK